MTRAANYHEAGPDTQADITDIDSIIEINGREIATTVQRGPVIYHKRNTRKRRDATSSLSSAERSRLPLRRHKRHELSSTEEEKEYSGLYEKESCVCLNGRESDLLSFHEWRLIETEIRHHRKIDSNQQIQNRLTVVRQVHKQIGIGIGCQSTRNLIGIEQSERTSSNRYQTVLLYLCRWKVGHNVVKFVDSVTTKKRRAAQRTDSIICQVAATDAMYRLIATGFFATRKLSAKKENEGEEFQKRESVKQVDEKLREGRKKCKR